MAYKTYTKGQIEYEIDSVLADNSTQSITAEDLRDVIKDYVTASTYAPVMIYAGILHHYEGTGDSARSIKELYYNPDFFAKQEADDPTNSYNIYKLSSISVTANNNTYVIAPTGGDGENLRLSIVVTANQVTSMTVIEPGSGYKVGDVLNLQVGATALTITYQGAVRAPSNNTYPNNISFTLTQNLDNLFFNHTENNTIVSATPVSYSHDMSTSLYRINRISDPNVLRCVILQGDDPLENLQHIQLYRVAENS